MDNIEYPESIYFGFGDFGWEVNKLDTPEEKASYLYTALLDTNTVNEYVSEIDATLRSKNIDAIFQSMEETDTSYYYIDHSGDLDEFISVVCNSEESLLSYLFSNKSFILTGNDNDETDVDIKVDYPHIEFYKAN